MLALIRPHGFQPRHLHQLQRLHQLVGIDVRADDAQPAPLILRRACESSGAGRREAAIRNLEIPDLVTKRLPNPKGVRVNTTTSGKFLPYKYYGASGNVPGIRRALW
jgi:hypothetical protein